MQFLRTIDVYITDYCQGPRYLSKKLQNSRLPYYIALKNNFVGEYAMVGLRPQCHADVY